MYNLNNLRYDPAARSKWIRFFLLGIISLFIGASIFITGFFLGTKMEAKKQGLLHKTQEIRPVTEEQKSKTEELTLKQVQGKNEDSRHDTPQNIPKETEGPESKDKDLTFYQTLASKKKQNTVTLEPAQKTDQKQVQVKSQESSGRAGNPNKTYTVQVGAYKEKDVAEKVMSKLKKKGYSAYIVSRDIQGEGTIYKVRVGEFPHRDRAEEQARRIKLKEKMPTFVTLK